MKDDATIETRQYGAFGDTPRPEPDRPQPPPPNPPSAVQDPPRIEVSPDSDVAGHEDVCTKRKTCVFLYGAFVEYARELYRDGEFLVGTPDVRWGRTPQHDGIWIDAEYNWKPANPEFLPAIYVKLGEVQYSFKTGRQWVGSNLRNGVERGDRTANGTVSFVHVSRSSGEAIALCDNTRYRLNEFSMAIERDLCLCRFFEQQVQPLALAQKVSNEAYQSTTTFSFEFRERWGIKLESPILRSVDIVDTGLQESRRYGIIRTGIS